MLNPGNVATPPAAATAVVPESVPPPGFAPIASVTVAMKAVAVLPCASCAVTWTAGAIDAPAVALDGWTESTRRVAARGARRRHGDHELARRPWRDGERRGRGPDEARAARRQRIARARLVDRQIVERRHSAHRGDGRRAGEGPAAQVRAERHRDV